MKKLLLYTTAAMILAACNKEDGPKAEDHFLNYEIKEIPVTADYNVGALYYEVGNFSANIKEVPVVGKYSMPNGVIAPAVMTKHLEYAEKAGINYFVFSFRSALRDLNAYKRDSTMIKSYLDNAGSSPVNFALSYNLNTGTYGINATTPLEKDPAKLEQFYQDFERVAALFNHPRYTLVNGKKLLYINQAQNLFSDNNKMIYTTLRTRMKALGIELYIVGMQDRWTPPARYYFRYQDCVDAVYHQNMRPNGYDQLYLLPQMINENWKYSKDYFMKHWKVDYVANVFPAYNWLINTPTSLNPNVERKDNGAMFTKMCNVAKMNASENNRMILIDSWNKWDEDLQIEPAASYGELYLDIVKKQFKK